MTADGDLRSDKPSHVRLCSLVRDAVGGQALVAGLLVHSVAITTMLRRHLEVILSQKNSLFIGEALSETEEPARFEGVQGPDGSADDRQHRQQHASHSHRSGVLDRLFGESVQSDERLQAVEVGAERLHVAGDAEKAEAVDGLVREVHGVPDHACPSQAFQDAPLLLLRVLHIVILFRLPNTLFLFFLFGIRARVRVWFL